MHTWNLVLPPSRPDKLDLARISKAAKSIDRSAIVGVLGSTPEFRDLLYELGFRRIVVFERNISFYAAVSRQRVYENKEILVEGDWIETLPQFTSKLKLLLSDLTAGNIAYDQRRKFYAVITQALTTGGLFIDKLLTNENGLISIRQIQRKYSSTPVNLQTANYFSCEAIFCSELQEAAGRIETTSIYDRLTESLSGARLKKFIEYSQLITPMDCLWYYGLPWCTLEQAYCPGLELLAKNDLASHQPYYRRAYQYIWQKGRKNDDHS